MIKVNGSNEEIFVDATGLKEYIKENDEVVFDVENGKKGLNAVNVSVV
jgi:cold shock protein